MTKDEIIALALRVGATERHAVYTFSGTQLKMFADQLTAQPAAPAVVEWQPIETAPKDGSIFLIGLPIAGNLREGDRRVYEARWHEGQQQFTSVNGFILFGGATHWMPLPNPPEGKQS